MKLSEVLVLVYVGHERYSKICPKIVQIFDLLR